MNLIYNLKNCFYLKIFEIYIIFSKLIKISGDISSFQYAKSLVFILKYFEINS